MLLFDGRTGVKVTSCVRSPPGRRVRYGSGGTVENSVRYVPFNTVVYAAIHRVGVLYLIERLVVGPSLLSDKRIRRSDIRLDTNQPIVQYIRQQKRSLTLSSPLDPSILILTFYLQ